MIKSILRTLGLLALVTLAACSIPRVSQAQLDQAKALSYGLENAYVLTVKVATTWAQRPRCGTEEALPPPFCSTARGILSIEEQRRKARAALTGLSNVIADARASPDAITVAMSTAREAMAAYQEIAGKGEGK